MPLHRDIFWIGRQWAVTGFGMQVINRKVGEAFDVEIARLWDDDPTIILREQSWFNAEDFAKGLAVARSRHAAPSRKTAPPPLPVETRLAAGRTNAPAAAVAPPAAQPAEVTRPAAPPSAEILLSKPAALPAEEIVPPKPAAPPFELRIASLPAKLGAMWRVRRHK